LRRSEFDGSVQESTCLCPAWYPAR
jgi:hypothetical protein